MGHDEDVSQPMNAKPRDMSAAVKCLDSSGVDATVWDVRAKELAGTLKTVVIDTKPRSKRTDT